MAHPIASRVAIMVAATLAFPAGFCLALSEPEPPGIAATAPEARTDEASLAAAIDTAVNRHTLGEWWGAMIVAKDGKPLLTKCCGFASDALGPITADSLFDIGSISKQFTAAAILLLEQEGKLSVNDPVEKFLASAKGSGITIEHLLRHTSGKSDSTAIERLDQPSRAAAEETFFTARGRKSPGERFEYCNAGYIMLAAVIEEASGQPFQAFMRRRIFGPAGLTSTGFIDGEGLDPARQTARIVGGTGGQKPRRGLTFDEPWGWGLRGCGGVVTTLNDLVRWDEALRGDAVLSRAKVDRLYEPGMGGYGRGWFVGPDHRGGLRVEHGGATRGYTASLVRFPREGIVIAVLTNERGEPTRMTDLVQSVMFPGDTQRIIAQLVVSDRKLSPWRSHEAEEFVRWRVLPPGKGEGGNGKPGLAQAILTRASDDEVMARLWLSPSTARAVAGKLDSLGLGDKPAIAAMKKTGFGLYLRPYAEPRGGVIELTESLLIEVRPRYESGDNDKASDDRPMLAIVDTASQFWPLILKMDPATARELRDQLRDALTEGRSSGSR